MPNGTLTEDVGFSFPVFGPSGLLCGVWVTVSVVSDGVLSTMEAVAALAVSISSVSLTKEVVSVSAVTGPSPVV